MTSVLCVGHAVEDRIYYVDAIPTIAAKHQALGYEAVGGGPAANAAVAISRLGGKALLSARLGDDPAGDSILRDLETENVDCSLVRQFHGNRSSTSAVFVDASGERLIVNDLDATMPASPDWLIAAFPDYADAVLADIRWPEGAKAALSKAKTQGLPAILDADHPFPHDDALLDAATHIAFSADGLKKFTNNNELEAALLDVATKTAAWVCVTNGGDGTLIAAESGINRTRAFNVNVVDTLGAGDIWHGAFALALAEGRREEDAVIFASGAAALKVSRKGGRNGAPTRAETDAFLQEFALETLT